jgi:hypothetical protein
MKNLNPAETPLPASEYIFADEDNGTWMRAAYLRLPLKDQLRSMVLTPEFGTGRTCSHITH